MSRSGFWGLRLQLNGTLILKPPRKLTVELVRYVESFARIRGRELSVLFSRAKLHCFSGIQNYCVGRVPLSALPPCSRTCHLEVPSLASLSCVRMAFAALFVKRRRPRHSNAAVCREQLILILYGKELETIEISKVTWSTQPETCTSQYGVLLNPIGDVAGCAGGLFHRSSTISPETVRLTVACNIKINVKTHQYSDEGAGDAKSAIRSAPAKTVVNVHRPMQQFRTDFHEGLHQWIKFLRLGVKAHR